MLQSSKIDQTNEGIMQAKAYKFQNDETFREGIVIECERKLRKFSGNSKDTLTDYCSSLGRMFLQYFNFGTIVSQPNQQMDPNYLKNYKSLSALYKFSLSSIVKSSKPSLDVLKLKLQVFMQLSKLNNEHSRLDLDDLSTISMPYPLYTHLLNSKTDDRYIQTINDLTRDQLLLLFNHFKSLII
jgi:hypothetical protein